ncbi:hypothetical protein EOT10_32295 [Streptomyces antnestii]|uniref:Uncharacterized protein n=1 Tax=Streptomyces antnestii TaxID=2494256 RepID=A0A437P7J4_9ACTN|nr:hypothetical protein [Streptomyces sp. San01]RVU18260.1 hypothetical protein EOT10_32295 [Streptomyces sp. San01]
MAGRKRAGLVVAAVRLVAEHRTWLNDPEFYRFVATGEMAGQRWVGIDWPAIVKELKAGTIEGGEPDLLILKVGASMASYYPLSLRDDLRDQSPEAAVALMRSIGYLAGLNEDVDNVRLP